ncbi:metal-sulfur cluster assembly factor [Pampinifervens florentissimum]|uniref:metal-sulfur cluster assembly factor n=1 Tax=Pampinifervens florentissimum TaxID=1632019 RepID=UPI0020C51FB8|nr:iron-sulfur cluster assembly protein [Hydrogenobacter sp. T-8]
MEDVLKVLKEVIDPHTGMDIVGMNMVREVKEIEQGRLRVVIKPTSPFCPVGSYLLQAVKEKVEGLGYKADVELEGYLFGVEP